MIDTVVAEHYVKQAYDRLTASLEFYFIEPRNHLQAYCKSDVELLMQGCLAFRKSIIEVTKSDDDPNFLNGIDPFCVSVTIASLCHYIFRNKMLKKNQIILL